LLPPPAAPTLADLRDRETLRGEVLARRAGQPRAHKLVSTTTRSFLERVVGTHFGDLGADLAVLSAPIKSKSGPTWDRYVGVIRPWFDLAASASPILFPLPFRLIPFSLQTG